MNRFVVQAVAKFPLTVYGKGGQTRGYLNINDTLQCVDISSQNAAKRGEMRIFNQIMETFSVNQLANLVKIAGDKRGHNVEVNSIENPRKEAEDHYYNPTYQGLQEIGVKPNYLTDEVLDSFFQIVESCADNIRRDVIFKGVKWD